MQSPSFCGEGADVERIAKIWIEQMDDYFAAARTAPANQAMLGMFRLIGDAKLWWKQHCRDQGVSENSQTWAQIKQAVKERYLPPSHETLKMNEFFKLRQASMTLEEYYSKFVTLRRYAPLMSSEQQIARFCQGLNSPLDSRLEAMRPTSIQDALIRAKPLVRESGFERGQKKREPFQPKWKDGGYKRNSTPIENQPRVYAANTPVRDISMIRCYECDKLGHYRSNCPELKNRVASATTAEQRPQDQRPPQQHRGGNQGRGRGRGRVARVNGRGGRAYAAAAEPTVNDEANKRATLYAAIDNPGAQNQYAVIQTKAIHQGETFDLLIDCGSTHSFLSPKCLRKLKLNQYPVRAMTVELANGKEVLSNHAVGTINFELGGKNTAAFFRTLPVGVYDGILGMDWLRANHASIHCAQGTFSLEIF